MRNIGHGLLPWLGLRFIQSVGILLLMETTVTITTGTRLHFGPLAAAGSTGGKFGGVGMMVTSPGFVVRASTATLDGCRGDEVACRRGAEFVQRIRESSRDELSIPPCRLEFQSVIPAHAGLGQDAG